ncbi:hypothetical protein GJ496_002560 [Pomphorhynchus laevis]|nr:hypothetical protein GJ496_002560 [Pomphorhynchus laevis]
MNCLYQDPPCTPASRTRCLAVKGECVPGSFNQNPNKFLYKLKRIVTHRSYCLDDYQGKHVMARVSNPEYFRYFRVSVSFATIPVPLAAKCWLQYNDGARYYKPRYLDTLSPGDAQPVFPSNEGTAIWSIA